MINNTPGFKKSRTGDILQMIDLFFKGGVLMVPLFACSLAMLALIIERLIAFAGTGVSLSFVNHLKSGTTHAIDPGEISSGSWKNRPIQQLLLDIIRMKHQPKEVIEEHISIRGELYLHHLEARLPLLELIGRIAPMMGLLGTVMGMVAAFRQVAVVETVADPSILAGGIWEALITTVSGLIVGIPALIAYHLFTTRLERIAFLMKHYSVDLINYVKGAND